MPTQTRIVSPGPGKRTVKTSEGKVLQIPAKWKLLPPGDAGVTRRVKSRGPSWTVKQKKGRRTYSLGVWAPAKRIESVKAEIKAQRATPAYAKRMASAARRRDKKQAQYVEDFRSSVLKFLNFADCHSELAERLATAVAAHATPVGSGTVARTQRIPIEQRAESAVIAWMRHQTTAYDNMAIPRVKGKRREVRRMLAEASRKRLKRFRNGAKIDHQTCPLCLALTGSP